MSGHHVLITGASGFVGSHVKAELRERDISFVALDEPQAVDIRESEHIDETIIDAKPTAVIHLAAVSALNAADKDRRVALDVNLVGTYNLASSIRKHVPECHLIFASSSEVYGESFKHCAESGIAETASLRPISFYGATKAAAESILSHFAFEGLPTTIFRAFNHTGPGQVPTFAVPAFAKQIAQIRMNKEPPKLRVGNLQAERDFCDVRDVAKAYVSAAMRTVHDAGPTILNIGSGKSVSLTEIVETLVELAGRDIEIEVDRTLWRSNEIRRTVADLTKIHEHLGWRPTIPLRRTLQDVLDHHEAEIGLD